MVFLLLFLFSILAQSYTGHKVHNEFLAEYGVPPLSFRTYLTSGHFLQATFENWESEFFQMGLFVVLTIFLHQQGSSESRPLKDSERGDELRPKRNSPSWVKKGGIYLWLYKYSLSIVLFALFILSFLLHWYGSWMDENEQLFLEGKTMVSRWKHLCDNRFWFESFQNWQSEFLSVFALVFLSIYLRQKGSPQSKKVNDPHYKTGE